MPGTTAIGPHDVTTGVPVGLLDAHLLSDAALRRVATGASYVVSWVSEGDGHGLAARWSALAPGVPLVDGGTVPDVRSAILACAERKMMVLATGAPADAARFVGRCLQGAAAAAERELPVVAVHVLRDHDRPGPVAWLTQTGLMSGYGVLFAVGFAQLHGVGVTLVEPVGGAEEPRSPHAHQQALELAASSGVETTTVSDPSPLARVLRDAFSAVVHPVLDALDGHALLRPDELPRSSVSGGNPGAVVTLLEEFEGDVVAVYDGVRLLEGDSHLAATLAGVVVGAVALTGVGAALAPSAGAASLSTDQATTATANVATMPGVTVTATGHNGTAHTGTFHVVNRLTEPVTLSLQAVWSHSGNHPDIVVPGPTVTVGPGAAQDVSFVAPRPTGVTGQGGYHITGPAKSWNIVVTDTHGHVLTTIHTTPGGQLPPVVQTPQVPVTQLVPQYRPVVVQGHPGDLLTEIQEPPQVVPQGPAHVTIPQTTVQTPQPHVTTPPVTQVPTLPIAVTNPPVPDGSHPPVRTHEPVVAPTLQPALPTAIATPPSGTQVPPAHPQEPTAVPTTTPQPTVTPQVPVTTPDVHPPVATPTLTPQVPQHPPIVTPPVATPDVHPPVATPTLTPQVPQHPPVITPPVATPDVHPPVATPTLTPQVPPLTPQVTETTVTPQGQKPVVEEIVEPPILQPITTTGTTTTTTTDRVIDPPDNGVTEVTVAPRGTPERPDTQTPTEGLAHTGAAQTGLLAGLAAAFVAAGVGMTVLGRRRPEDGDDGTEAPA